MITAEVSDVAYIVGALCLLAGTIATAIATIVVGLRKARDENREQHAENAAKLDQLVGKVDATREDVREIRDGLAEHIADHRGH